MLQQVLSYLLAAAFLWDITSGSPIQVPFEGNSAVAGDFSVLPATLLISFR